MLSNRYLPWGIARSTLAYFRAKRRACHAEPDEASGIKACIVGINTPVRYSSTGFFARLSMTSTAFGGKIGENPCVNALRQILTGQDKAWTLQPEVISGFFASFALLLCALCVKPRLCMKPAPFPTPSPAPPPGRPAAFPGSGAFPEDARRSAPPTPGSGELRSR